MAHRARAVILSVVVDKLDAAGNIVEELTSQPVKLFPSKFGSLATEVAGLVARLDKEEKGQKAPAPFPHPKRKV